MTTHFIVHEPGDSVGVIVVEGVKKGDKLNGWIMDGDSDIQITTLDDIPIGHKIALKDLNVGDTVIKLSNESSGDPQNERNLTPSVLSRGPGTGQRGSER